jgi:hypothetical protein
MGCAGARGWKKNLSIRSQGLFMFLCGKCVCCAWYWKIQTSAGQSYQPKQEWKWGDDELGSEGKKGMRQ